MQLGDSVTGDNTADRLGSGMTQSCGECGLEGERKSLVGLRLFGSEMSRLRALRAHRVLLID